MSHIYNKLRRAKAGVTLSERELADKEIEVEVEAVDFDGVDIKRVIEAADQQIDHISKQRFKFGLYVLIALILLFLSIKGVQFEISVLGVKLSQIQSIKEVILLGMIAAGVHSQMKSDQLTELKSLKKMLYIKCHGDAAYIAFRRTFLNQSNDNYLPFFLVNKNFNSVGFGQLIKRLSFVRLFVGLTTTLVLYTWVIVSIILDVWKQPIIDPLYARLICIFALIVFLNDFFTAFARGLMRFEYIDRKIWRAYDVYQKGTKELSEETLEFVRANDSAKK